MFEVHLDDIDEQKSPYSHIGGPTSTLQANYRSTVEIVP